MLFRYATASSRSRPAKLSLEKRSGGGGGGGGGAKGGMFSFMRNEKTREAKAAAAAATSAGGGGPVHGGDGLPPSLELAEQRFKDSISVVLSEHDGHPTYGVQVGSTRGV